MKLSKRDILLLNGASFRAGRWLIDNWHELLIALTKSNPELANKMIVDGLGTTLENLQAGLAAETKRRGGY